MKKVKEKFTYTCEAYDFVTNLVHIKNAVIRAQRKEIKDLRNLLTGRPV